MARRSYLSVYQVAKSAGLRLLTAEGDLYLVTFNGEDLFMGTLRECDAFVSGWRAFMRAIQSTGQVHEPMSNPVD